MQIREMYYYILCWGEKRARVLHLERNSFRVCTYAPRIYLNRPRNLSRSRINLWFQNFNAVSSLSLALSFHYCCSSTARAVFTLFRRETVVGVFARERKGIYVYAACDESRIPRNCDPYTPGFLTAMYGFWLTLCNTINQRGFTFQICAQILAILVKQPLKI